MLTRCALLVTFAEVMLSVLRLNHLRIGRRTRHNNGSHDAESDLGPANAQTNDRAFLQLHSWNPAIVDVDAITAVEITQPPFAILDGNTGVESTDKLVLDADIAFLSTPNLE